MFAAAFLGFLNLIYSHKTTLMHLRVPEIVTVALLCNFKHGHVSIKSHTKQLKTQKTS